MHVLSARDVCALNLETRAEDLSFLGFLCWQMLNLWQIIKIFFALNWGSARCGTHFGPCGSHWNVAEHSDSETIQLQYTNPITNIIYCLTTIVHRVYRINVSYSIRSRSCSPPATLEPQLELSYIDNAWDVRACVNAFSASSLARLSIHLANTQTWPGMLCKHTLTHLPSACCFLFRQV